MNHIRANGLDFAYLDEGTGPLVMLLHGFPDTAQTWSHQISALAAAGYRVAAPYLRGYYPSEIPRDGFYDKATLAMDIAEMIRALGGGKPVHLVGQDWCHRAWCATCRHQGRAGNVSRRRGEAADLSGPQFGHHHR